MIRQVLRAEVLPVTLTDATQEWSPRASRSCQHPGFFSKPATVGSVDQAGGLLASPPQHPALGNENGVGADPELSSDLCGFPAVEELATEGRPGHRGKLGFDQLQQPLRHKSVVLLVPAPRLWARWVLECSELGVVPPGRGLSAGLAGSLARDGR